MKKIVWRQSLAISHSLERFITWTVAGIAAFAALLISNLDSVAPLITRGGLKWGLLLLAFSILAGAVCKQLALAIPDGLARIVEMENFMGSEAGQQLLERMTIDPEKLPAELAAPYLWPMSYIVRKSAERGARDLLAADKRFVFLFCLQLWAFWLHVLLAIASIVVVAATILPSAEAAVDAPATAVSLSAEIQFFTFSPRTFNIVGLWLTFVGAALLFVYGYPFKKLSSSIFVIGPTVSNTDPLPGQPEENRDWQALANPFMWRAKWLNRAGFALVSVGTLLQIAAQHVGG
jgi:hypothetical protein